MTMLMGGPLHTVVETEPFLRKAKELGFSDEMRAAIVNAVAADPEASDGEVIASNVRKRRIPGQGRGKSGGYRIAVAYFGPDAPAYILAILRKGEADVFSDDQKKRIKGASDKVSRALKSKGKTKGTRG
ncbi:type II toxin-antitoxin system RelE/ParE family toxin [Enterovirga rhinocerotis]|nr:type II toxin-antitoxin system RelE/ParE family toxin [Enterovirga rhinocerotis]